MTARVFHFNMLNGLTFDESRQQAKWPDSYRLVAIVDEAHSVDDAFRLTNTIDEFWWKNEDVIAFSPLHVAASGERGWRSTSVGDVIEFRGEFFKCKDSGWERIDKLSGR